MRRLLPLLLLALLPLAAHAADVKSGTFQSGGLWYEYDTMAGARVIASQGEPYAGDIVIPAAVSYEGRTYDVVIIQDNAFAHCAGVTSVTIPSTISRIDDFSGCTGLTAVYISDLAAWCNIHFGYPESNPLFYAHHLYLDGQEVSGDLTFPDDVTAIRNYTFVGCNLRSVTIPQGVTTIGGNNPFAYCAGLTTITVDPDNPNYDSRNGCNAIIRKTDNTLISGCVNTRIPDDVTTLGVSSFRGCTALSTITIPTSVKTIGEQAFQDCSGLTTLRIPNSVTFIRGSAFVNCTSLTALYFGHLPSMLKGTFKGCTVLTDLYCYAEIPTTFRINPFDGLSMQNLTLHVPAATVDSYRSAAVWSDFGRTVALSDDVLPPDIAVPQCATPTISYHGGQLTFASATDDVTFHYTVTPADTTLTGTGDHVTLSLTYHVSVYATRLGYEASPVAEATLCWVDAEPTSEGVTAAVVTLPARALLVQRSGDHLLIQGFHDRTPVSVYSADGRLLGSATSTAGTARVPATLRTGDVAIIKAKDMTMKMVVK